MTATLAIESCRIVNHHIGVIPKEISNLPPRVHVGKIFMHSVLFCFVLVSSSRDFFDFPQNFIIVFLLEKHHCFTAVGTIVLFRDAVMVANGFFFITALFSICSASLLLRTCRLARRDISWVQSHLDLFYPFRQYTHTSKRVLKASIEQVKRHGKLILRY